MSLCVCVGAGGVLQQFMEEIFKNNRCNSRTFKKAEVGEGVSLKFISQNPLK